MRGILKSVQRVSFWFVASPIALVVLFSAAAFLRMRGRYRQSPNVMFGVDPIINNKYWSKSVPRSETWVCEVYPINSVDDFDFVLTENWKELPFAAKYLLASLISLIRFDVFCLSFNGGFLGRTPLAWAEPYLFKMAGKKTIILAFGSDSYVYRRISSAATIHALLMSYPQPARQQARIARRVERWTRHGDIVLPGVMTLDGFGRWDAVLPSILFLDLDQWRPTTRRNVSDGSGETVIITHSPNHRGFKGTEFVVAAVEHLKSEGLSVELKLIERMKNEEVRRILEVGSDIHVEQIICAGHGMNGLEAMASGLPVLSNLEDHPDFVKLMTRYSYLGECPIYSASPESITYRLRTLVTSPTLRRDLGILGRQYVERHHGLDASARLLNAAIAEARSPQGRLIRMFEPARD